MRHVELVHIWERSDAFSKTSLKKIERADAIFFTGGDQMNVTSLMGGTPLHNLMHEKEKEGVLIAGTSAGAAMMSASMITSGKSEVPPVVGGVKIAPGMGLISDTIIDSHFTQRGRHGRLMTAVAHYPQILGLGIDELTGIVVRGVEFRVIGPGTVVVFDASKMEHCDLPYRKEGETVAMFGIRVTVLREGYHYNINKREARAPKVRTMAG